MTPSICLDGRPESCIAPRAASSSRDMQLEPLNSPDEVPYAPEIKLFLVNLPPLASRRSQTLLASLRKHIHNRENKSVMLIDFFCHQNLSVLVVLSEVRLASDY